MPDLLVSEQNFLNDYYIISRGRASDIKGNLTAIKYSELIIYFSNNYESVPGFDSIWLELMVNLDNIFIKNGNK